jgi:ribosomal protein S18 acetylase RimI-like enzyme
LSTHITAQVCAFLTGLCKIAFVNADSLDKKSGLRPVNIYTDLDAIANLIEICFGNNLDPDGREYVRQIRRAAQNPSYISWIAGSGERVSYPLFGYVWVEEEKVAGNLTLIPFRVRREWYYFIANVATHPDYRRRGIARKLTECALQHAQNHGASAAWLQVRDDNEAAYQLYLSFNMVERARRSSWQSKANQLVFPEPLPEGLTIGKRRPCDWQLQQEWLQATYPPEVAWNLNFRLEHFGPNWWHSLIRFLHDRQYRMWAIYAQDCPIGLAALESTHHHADTLWVACDPKWENLVIQTLLYRIRYDTQDRRPLLVNYPAYRAAQAFQESGFELQNTLIWMEKRFKT